MKIASFGFYRLKEVLLRCFFINKVELVFSLIFSQLVLILISRSRIAIISLLLKRNKRAARACSFKKQKKNSDKINPPHLVTSKGKNLLALLYF